jgi:lipopolysaccharide export system permease protein
MPTKQDIDFRALTLKGLKGSTARFELEWHRKFTLSFACLIFFFIGGSLGSIIRKGGIGTSAVVSVFLFIVYYIIDITGYKLARDVQTSAWFGMWLSAMVLAPLGIFLTYKAMKDAVIMNTEAYVMFFKRVFSRKIKRELSSGEGLMSESVADLTVALNHLNQITTPTIASIQYFPSYVAFWNKSNAYDTLCEIAAATDSLVKHLQSSGIQVIVRKLEDYPIIETDRFSFIPSRKEVRRIIAWCFPLGLLLYFYAKYQNKLLLEDLRAILRVNQEVTNLFENN